MKIPRGKYIAKNADPHKHEAEHFFMCETSADGLIAVILAACLIIRDRITCRRKIESTRVNQMPWSRPHWAVFLFGGSRLNPHCGHQA